VPPFDRRSIRDRRLVTQSHVSHRTERSDQREDQSGTSHAD